MSILYIHDFVANIVGRLNEIHQRMPRIAHALAALVFKARYAQFVGNALEGVALGFEKTKLGFLGKRGTKRIFYNGGKGGISHHEAAAPTSVEMVREQAEGIGVAVEARNVVPLTGREVESVFHLCAAPLRKEAANGALARVTERRVAHIVGEAGGRNHCAELAPKFIGIIRITLFQNIGDISAQRAPHARHFEAVRQAVVHEYAARQGKHLRLVLHAPEGGREDKAVVVALKFRAPLRGGALRARLAPAFRRNELLPIHKKQH